MSGELKADITRNEYGTYEIEVSQDRGGGWLPRPMMWGKAWTQRGARRKARRLLAEAQQRLEFEAFKETLHPNSRCTQ